MSLPAWRLLEVERASRLHGAGAQQRARAMPAVRDGLQGDRAGRAACRSAIDASEVVERGLVRAAATRHGALRRARRPYERRVQELFQTDLLKESTGYIARFGRYESYTTLSYEDYLR